MNEWINEWTNEWINEWMNEIVDEWIHELPKELIIEGMRVDRLTCKFDNHYKSLCYDMMKDMLEIAILAGFSNFLLKNNKKYLKMLIHIKCIHIKRFSNFFFIELP